MEPLTLEQRKAILDEAVANYALWGYQLVAHSGTSAQLVKPGRSAAPSCVLIVLTFGIWLIVEMVLIALGVGRQKSVLVEVDAYGQLHKR
jgi:hypothetical protein